MKYLVPLVLVCLAAMSHDTTYAAGPGSGAPPRQPATAPAPLAPATRPATAPAVTAEQIYRTLVANTWMTRRPGVPMPLGDTDYSVAVFAPDGNWSMKLITDHPTKPQTGKWNLQHDDEANGGLWYVCTDDGRRRRIALNSDGTISLEHGRLFPKDPIPADPRHSAATLPKLVFTPELRAIIERLTANAWKRTNDLGLDHEPTSIRLSADWTYVATYRHGQCTSRGNWYATVEGSVATSPEGRCDTRLGSGGDQLRLDVTPDGQVLVGGDLYVPEGQPVKRGVIFALPGYETVTPIRVEYDMPVRAGVPTRFDVTITNASSDPLVLGRFGLTEKYNDYGRSASVRAQAVVPKDELAATDLALNVLLPGKSHAFAIEHTFPKAGKHSLYFNALITGTTQNWDTHGGYEFIVHARE